MKLPKKSFGNPEDIPLVFVHGLFGQGRNLSAAARALSSKRHVITVDLRNHGDAPWDPDHSYDAMAEDIYDSFRDYAQIDLMGHSMGGKAAMWLALNRSDFIRKLAVADIAPVTYLHGHQELIDAMLAVDLTHIKSRRQLDDALTSGIPDIRTRSFLIHGFDTRPEPRWTNNLTVLRDAMDQITGWPKTNATYTGKTLFIAGEKSDYVLDAHRPAIKSHFPNAKLIKLKDAGHWLHAEQADAFNALLGEYFSP